MKFNYVFIFVSMAILLITAPLFSQNYTGIKARFDLANAPIFVNNHEIYQFENRQTNMGFSLFAEFPISNLFTIVPEIAYSRRSTTYSRPDTMFQKRFVHSDSKYLQFPIAIKANLPIQSYVFSVSFATHFDIALQMENDQNIGSISESINGLKEKKFQRHDVGLSLGVGIEKHIAKKIKTVLQIRYAHGLFDLNPDPQSQFYNKGFSLEVGLSTPVRI